MKQAPASRYYIDIPHDPNCLFFGLQEPAQMFLPVQFHQKDHHNR